MHNIHTIKFCLFAKKNWETLENIISINKIEKEKSNICDYLFETIAWLIIQPSSLN